VAQIVKVEIRNSCFTPRRGEGSFDVGVGKSRVRIAEDKLTTSFCRQLSFQ